MMRGPEKTCVAVRKPDGEIELRELNVSQKKSVWKRIPIVRGVYNFGASLAVGFKALNLSAEVSMTEEVSEPTKFDRFLDEKLGDKAAGVITTFTIVVAVLLALALFILLPYYLARGIEWVFRTELGFWFYLAEGLVRILIFLLYIVLVSRMPDIKRLFQYHGAEHKTVHCYEHAEALEVENVRRYSCLHKRCGTNLLLIVMILSILIFSIIQVQNPILRIVLRILLLPVVAGVSYEALKLIGRYDNWIHPRGQRAGHAAAEAHDQRAGRRTDGGRHRRPQRGDDGRPCGRRMVNSFERLYGDGVSRLRAAGADAPEFACKCLLEHVFQRPCAALLCSGAPPDPEPAARYCALVEKHASGYPLQYIVGEWEFLSLPIRVEEGVLIPRPDTETVALAAASFLEGRGPGARFLELGSGSGCISVALAKRTGCSGAAVDVSETAVRLTRENAARNGVDSQLCIRRRRPVLVLPGTAGRRV